MLYDITEEEYRRVEELRTESMPFRDIKALLFKRYPDMPTPTLRKKYYFWLAKAEDVAVKTEFVGPRQPGTLTWSGRDTNESVVTYAVAGDPRTRMVISTLDELLDVAKVDQSVWRVVRWKPNAWGQVSNERGYSTMYQVTAWLERLVPLGCASAIRQAVDDIKNVAPHRARISYSSDENKQSVMAEINLSDLHAGKRAWKQETGEEYNLDIARERLMRTASELFEHVRPYNVESIVVSLCGDMVNADGPEGKTTRGTPQDMSGLYLETFRATRDMLVDAIRLFTTIAPVKVIIVAGNHDKYTTYLLADMLEAIFWNDENVAVDNMPMPRKYHVYGDNLIGFAHRPDYRKLPGLMVVEMPVAWGKTTHHEFHAGHFHKEEVRVDTVYGVVIRTVPALSASDEWHIEAGFRGARAGAQAFLWHKTKNLIGVFNAFV